MFLFVSAHTPTFTWLITTITWWSYDNDYNDNNTNNTHFSITTTENDSDNDNCDGENNTHNYHNNTMVLMIMSSTMTITLKWLDTIFGSHRSPHSTHICWHICAYHTHGHWSPKYTTLWAKSPQICILTFNGAVPLIGGPLGLWVQYLWQNCLWSYYSVWLYTPNNQTTSHIFEGCNSKMGSEFM